MGDPQVPAVRRAARCGWILLAVWVGEAVAVILFCKLCDRGTPYTGEIPERCEACGRVTKWSTSSMKDRQAAAIMWTAEDRRFLRSMRIGTDD